MHRLGVPKSIYLYSSSGNGEVSRAAYHHLQSILLHNGGGQSGPAALVSDEKLHIMDKFFWLDGLFHEDIRMNPVQILI